MRICIFGAGAVGSHFAARLAAAGNEVSVLARGAQLDAAGLRELVGCLAGEGQGRPLGGCLLEGLAGRRAEGLARVSALTGAERLAEVARLFSEEGFMAEPATAADGTPALRMRHCPLRDLVAATDLPCQAEMALAQELAGQPLVRIEHGAHERRACTYGLSSRNL